MRHVVCVRVGDAYSRQYVAILHAMISRNLRQEFRFWCVTDDAEPIHPDIEIIPAHPDFPGWWSKLYLFAEEMPWVPGERVMYFDLDTVIMGDLEPVFETKGIIRDWYQPEYNSSVMVWDHGEHRNVWTELHPEVLHDLAGDQSWITQLDHPAGMTMLGDLVPTPSWALFPRDWFLSFKGMDPLEWPPHGTKAVIYHGRPKPSEVDSGWTPQFWRIDGGLSEFPALTDTNVSLQVMLDNVKANCTRDLPWFVGAVPHKGTAVIVGGAPSLKDHIKAIKAHRQRGAKIIALNNAAAYLNWHGIVPDTLFVCDARPENVVFVRAEAKRYVLASQCDGALFDELEGKDVHVVHLAICEEMRSILAPYDNDKPIVLIGGGSTVGLRAMNLVIFCGYKKLHVYGMDSSFADTGEHHAYDQALNDHDKTVEVMIPATGKRYLCAPWMVRQTNEYRDIAHKVLAEHRVQHWVHGKGALPDMWKALTNGSA